MRFGALVIKITVFNEFSGELAPKAMTSASPRCLSFPHPRGSDPIPVRSSMIRPPCSFLWGQIQQYQ